LKYHYNILPEALHPLANLAIAYFVKRRGVPASSIKIEQAIDIELTLPYRPTFNGKTTDHYILCVDVSESAYNNSLDAFVLECVNKCAPVKLFISIPKGTKDPEYSQKLKAARNRGVGILEIDAHSSHVVQEALPLSLAGVRPIPVESFPPKLRENLTRAETMFRDGCPDKACSLVFDEIESLCRVVGRKTYDAGCWNVSGAVTFKFNTGPWARLMEMLGQHLDAKKAKCPQLTRAFLARIHGVTPHRNESGHKPETAEELRKRDRELRTRFESAVDLLNDLITAVKPLHVV
jgi:hypothetical protein